MKALVPLALLLVTACADGPDRSADAAPADARPLDAQGSPLRVLTDGPAGPDGDDPACEQLLPEATCTRVGDVVWTLQGDGGSWQLTAFVREDGRWTPRLQGSGGGLSPTVAEADLTDVEQPETLVVYGAGFDVVSTPEEATAPVVVAHGEGQATVEAGAVHAGDREVRAVDGRWVSVPARSVAG